MFYKDFYSKEHLQKVIQDFEVQNIFAVPRIKKIVLNVGAGEAVTNKNVVDEIAKQLGIITGQKAVITKARRSVSAFKIREGLPIGVKVTLRGKRMVAFLDKFVHIIVPHLKDFRGIKDSCVDNHGNLNIGLSEQTIFPEIDYDAIDKTRGLQVTISTDARSHGKGRKLFEVLGIPFVKS